MKVDAIHFHSYPFTSLEAQEKALHLAEKLRPYNMGILLHNVPLTHLQEEIIRNCDRSYLTVILRRCMFRCAQQLAQVNGLQALITGESLGQLHHKP
jgi:thiamine biosynthesis protein ThiI